MAGPKGVGQEARSKSPWIQEISHITTGILPYAFRASSDYGFYLRSLDEVKRNPGGPLERIQHVEVTV
jgi:hypothetical protein